MVLTVQQDVLRRKRNSNIVMGACDILSWAPFIFLATATHFVLKKYKDRGIQVQDKPTDKRTNVVL